jgi:hypothetical protein
MPSPMPSDPRPSGPRRPQVRPLRYLPTVISALCAFAILQMAHRDPRYLLPCAVIVGMMIVPPYLARRRMRRLLLSGDVKAVLGTWQSTIERVMFPETMAPLMAATAYAAYGWVDAGRTALERAVKGPAWDAAVEQRLFVEALLDTFQGDRASGLLKAEELERMPLPSAGFLGRLRIAKLRRGLSALARAFAHRSDHADTKRLLSAASSTPLVHWAMRYGAAVVAIDRGAMVEARALLEGAPSWPEQSAFRVFDAELRGLITV